MLKLRCYALIVYRFSSSSLRTNNPAKTADLSSFTPDKIRNFCIVAHVDHGKSTLSDRLLQLTNVIDKNEQAQFLDKLQVERQRGITVKAQSCSMVYKDHLLNLIDTPGHADFSFEVARSLAACDGMLLLIAANSGVQAQTLANFWLGFDQNLVILPVINKIDLPGANIDSVKSQLNSLFDFDPSEITCISAKSGLGVPAILDLIIDKIPPPNVDPNKPFKALIFDSWFEHFRGAIALIVVTQGSVSVGQKIRSYNAQMEYEVTEVGIMHPNMIKVNALNTGQVGYLICNMKTVKEAAVGETLFCSSVESKDVKPFSEFKPTKPSVYAGFFPFTATSYEELKKAVERLALNDPSVEIAADSSTILGLGWRIGFLGLLHMDVFSQRLEQEYNQEVIVTAPSVQFKCRVINNESIRKKRYNGQAEFLFRDPSQFPLPSDIESFQEPMIMLKMVTPNIYLDSINSLCTEMRGERGDISSLSDTQLLIKWRLPLNEIVSGFFDNLKRVTSGYVSFEYNMDGYRDLPLVKLVIVINDKPIDEFSTMVHESTAQRKAKVLVDKLKTEIPRQQYEVKIKACIGTSQKAICQGIIKPYKRDFTGLFKGNMSGSSLERLNKKLSHQREGKARMRAVGNLLIPKEAFINVIRQSANQEK